jgi:hypothetical protein
MVTYLQAKYRRVDRPELPLLILSHRYLSQPPRCIIPSPDKLRTQATRKARIGHGWFLGTSCLTVIYRSRPSASQVNTTVVRHWCSLDVPVVDRTSHASNHLIIHPAPTSQAARCERNPPKPRDASENSGPWTCYELLKHM